MTFRIVRSLLPVLILGLSAACTSPITRWEEPSAQRVSSAKARPATHRADGDNYTVQAGDTLYSIAYRNQLDYRDLASWNGIGSDYRIYPGRVLRLRPRSDTVSRATPSASAPAPAPVSRPRPAPAAPKAEPTPPAVAADPGAAAETAAAPAPAPVVSDSAASSAVPQAAINSGFEWFWPTTGTILKTYAPQAGFKGLDFGGNFGQPVFAAAPGRVVYSGNALKGYGELIIIKHNDTYLSAYSYNRTRNVKEGDVVTAGQPIGELGMGPENKPFLHFEIRERGQPVDPMRFLPKRETTPGARPSTN